MRIGIIGAGLAGLTCAWYLKKGGIHDFVIFESSDRAGGKLKTDKLDGYQLDRGFQVLLPAYPEAKAVLDYEKLQLQRFNKGSLIYKEGNKIPFYDPENGFVALAKTVLFGPGSLMDKIKLLKLKFVLNAMSVEDIFNRKNSNSSIEYLKQFDFSNGIIEEFWKPFYKGVFLEDNLSTDSKMLQFTFKMFAEAGAAIPMGGMEEIPKQLLATIGSDVLRTNTTITSYDSKTITVNGISEAFDKVVVACKMNEKVKYNAVTNMYFEAESLPINTKHIILNASKNGIINNVVLISNVAKRYSSGANYLISVSANGVHNDVATFLIDLDKMFGPQVANWRLVHSYIIKEALPEVNFDLNYKVKDNDGIYRCGDYLVQGSINGAMQSGRLVAEALLKEV